MSFLDLNASVLLAGVEIAPYIISLKRNHSLCNIVQTCEIECDRNLLDYLTGEGVELKTSNTLVISEFGVQKLTGHVRSIKYARTPDFRLQISGTDLYKYAKDYFIDESIGVSNGESVVHWIGQLLGLIGLSYVVDSPEIGARTVGPGIEFNLRTVDDALVEVLSYASAYIYVDGTGLVHIMKGAPNSGLSFITGPGGNVKRGAHELSDTNTRDVAKVWGFKGNVILKRDESPYITAEESVDLHLPVNKTVVYASNYVQTYTEAQRIAGEIIESLGKFDSVKNLEVVGNPDAFIGKKAQIYLDLETAILDEQATITTVDTSMDKDGYNMHVGLDEFCPKFAGWELSSPSYPLYAGTTKHGIYRSTDNGVTWAAFNEGLPEGNKYVTKMAYNYFDEGIAIVNNRVYFSNGLVWQECSLPSPVNSAGDTPSPTGCGLPIGVDSIGEGSFYVLTTQNLAPSGTVYTRNRTWLYSCINGGLQPADWESSAVHDDLDYDYWGVDVNSKNGYPYILVNKNSDPNFYLSGTKFQIGGSLAISRGETIGGRIKVTAKSYTADEMYGIVPENNRGKESTILRIWQNSPTYLSTGLIDFGWNTINVTVRLALGENFPGIPYGYGGSLLIPNLFFRPFIGYILGRAGHHGVDNDGATYNGGHYLTTQELGQGYYDMDIGFNRSLGEKNLRGGTDVCFYTGYSTSINGHITSTVYFNEEVKIFDSVFPDETTVPELMFLANSFDYYLFNLNNMSVGW